MNKALAYDERIVAFIDVLGFAKLVEASEADDTARVRIDKLIATDRLFEAFMKNMFPLVIAGFFSDSFVLSARAQDAIYLFRESGYLCRHLLTLGFAFRGAIVAGALYHEDRAIIGPAFVKAYRLERDAAIYPRVIIDDSAMQYWNDELNDDSPHAHLASLTKIGRDGQRFFDIFDPKWAEVFVPWTLIEPSEDTVPLAPVDFLNAVRGHIENGIVTHANSPAIRAKYAWLASEFNERASTLGVSLI